MNTCLFSTHTTLTKEHTRLSLWSLFHNQTVPVYWDNIIIYNTHPHAISNYWLVSEIARYDQYFNNIFLEVSNSRTLTNDVLNQIEFLHKNNLTKEPGRFLMLKSDYSVSRRFNEVFLKQPTEGKSIWTLPIYNCKEWVTDDMILERLDFDTFVPYDEHTYFVGGQNAPNTPAHPTGMLPDGEEHLKEFHPSVRFVAHNYTWDYNVHVFSNDTLECMLEPGREWLTRYIENVWGGINTLFSNMRGYVLNTNIDAFACHKFHDIKSVNCPHDRFGGKDTPGQRH